MHSAARPNTDVTELLRRWSDGEERALDRLTAVLYDRLRTLAHQRLQGERPNHTLNTTALVHEAYERLVDIDEMTWADRAHFLAMASTVMRRILVDYARKRQAAKRAGRDREVTLKARLVPDDRLDSMLDLDDALDRLAEMHERPARAVELYYFGGMTLEEAGEILDTSAATVLRDLRFARAWLAREWERTLVRERASDDS
jgi:RNA polymerase sigma factor (TIGR02999 family)